MVKHPITMTKIADATIPSIARAPYWLTGSLSPTNAPQSRNTTGLVLEDQ